MHSVVLVSGLMGARIKLASANVRTDGFDFARLIPPSRKIFGFKSPLAMELVAVPLREDIGEIVRRFIFWAFWQYALRTVRFKPLVLRNNSSIQQET